MYFLIIQYKKKGIVREAIGLLHNNINEIEKRGLIDKKVTLFRKSPIRYREVAITLTDWAIKLNVWQVCYSYIFLIKIKIIEK